MKVSLFAYRKYRILGKVTHSTALPLICISNSVICGDIWHKYHEWSWYSKLLVISRTVRRVKFETILKYHEWSCQISRTFTDHVFHGKPQTAKCHVTTALRSRLQFAVHVWTAGRASSSKWFTARFFATKNCTVSRLKVRSSFLYPFVMCLLDFWSRINELFLFFGR